MAVGNRSVVSSHLDEKSLTRPSSSNAMEALKPLGVASVYSVMFDCFEVAIVRVICPAVLVKWPADCFILCSAAAMHSIDTNLKYGNPYYQS